MGLAEAQRTTSNCCIAKGSWMKPWSRSGNSKIRKERAHVREVTKVANVALGLPVVGRDTAG